MPPNTRRTNTATVASSPLAGLPLDKGWASDPAPTSRRVDALGDALGDARTQPIRRGKRRYILKADQSDAGSA
eukprot:2634457-Pyramimonas_sp.AAC.1